MRSISGIFILSLLAATAISGCCNSTYQSVELRATAPEAQPPSEGALHVSDSFSHAQRVDITDAYRAVVGILRDPLFSSFISDKAPLATSPRGDCELVPPQDIAAALREYVDQGQPLQVNRSANLFKRYLCSATASTGQCFGTTTFADIVERWERQDEQPWFVNTVAHEMTHLLTKRAPGVTEFACKSTPGPQAIIDDGHRSCYVDSEWCDDAFLVSYAFGDLVQCFFQTRGTSEEGKRRAEFNHCYETTINMMTPRDLQRSKMKKSQVLEKCHDAPR